MTLPVLGEPLRSPKLVFEYSHSVCETSSGPLTTFVTPKRQPFFDRTGWCPYCRLVIPTVFDRTTKDLASNDDPCSERYYSTQVWSCSACGWWDLCDSENTGHDSVDPVFVTETFRHAILRAFDLASANLPLEALRSALHRQGDRILDVHHVVMERLVASVLSDFSPNCKVTHCGRSGDHGIDLLVVESDKIIAIQVKRRRLPESVERVSQVREFLGGSLVEGYQHLMYVSTADHFSSGPAGAAQFARDAVARRVVHSFELIDRHRLLGMLGLRLREPLEPWKAFLPPNVI